MQHLLRLICSIYLGWFALPHLLSPEPEFQGATCLFPSEYQDAVYFKTDLRLYCTLLAAGYESPCTEEGCHKGGQPGCH